jgi:hypothetical protein
MEATQKETPTKGRPAKEEKKLVRSINLKLTEDDYKAIAQRSASVGMKPTQYARQMTLNGSIKSRYTKEELDLRRKIAGMANNINQVARVANRDGFANAVVLLIDTHLELTNILDDR